MTPLDLWKIQPSVHELVGAGMLNLIYAFLVPKEFKVDLSINKFLKKCQAWFSILLPFTKCQHILPHSNLPTILMKMSFGDLSERLKATR